MEHGERNQLRCVWSWTASKGTSGTQSTGALTVNSSFTLTCAGAGGTIAQTAAVTVTAGMPTVGL